VAATLAAPSQYGTIEERSKIVAQFTDEQWAALNPIRSENKYENNEIQRQWASFLR
jgi:hypothetical protein